MKPTIIFAVGMCSSDSSVYSRCGLIKRNPLCRCECTEQCTQATGMRSSSQHSSFILYVLRATRLLQHELLKETPEENYTSSGAGRQERFNSTFMSLARFWRMRAAMNTGCHIFMVVAIKEVADHIAMKGFLK